MVVGEAPAALADVVAALKNTLRSSDVSASARDAALVEFAQLLVDKYLLGAATTSSSSASEPLGSVGPLPS